MLASEDENEAEVRRVDQENINRFARLNARLHEVRDEVSSLKKQLEHLEDASTELMMGSGEKVLLVVGGEAFLEVAEEEATAHCEKQVEDLQSEIDKLESEESGILAEQAQLKKELYGRFGKSINLEEN